MRVLLLVLLAACALAQRINNAELNDRGLVQRRLACLLDRGPCDRTASQIKAALPEVLQRNCRSCTPAQAAAARRLVSFTQQRYPAEWAQIQAKYRGR